MIVIAYKKDGEILGELTKKIKEKYNCEKICFTGRLDPMAKGKIIFLLNEDVKLMNNFMKINKIYTFNLTIGISTTSSDILGLFNDINLLNHKSLYLYLNKIKNTINEFNNIIYTQKYPRYSSYIIKKNGIKKPLWYMEKNNLLCDKDIPSHDITIYSLKINGLMKIYYNFNYFINKIEKLKEINGSFNKENIINQYNYLNKIKKKNTFILQIPLKAHVSSGTYIRQLCFDIGKKIGIPTCAENIERTDFFY